MINQSELNLFNSEDWKSEVISSILQNLKNKNFFADSMGYHLVLSGGNTPIPIYQQFKNLDLPWSKIHFWLADERCVPKFHPDSNEKVIKEALGMEILKKATFHSIAEGSPKESAALYSDQLKNIAFFDIAVLGIGEDGHTASLFPENDLGQNSSSDDVIPIYNSPKFPKERISLSLNKINQSNHVLFLVSGKGKKEIIQKIKAGHVCPASKVRGRYSTKIFYCID